MCHPAKVFDAAVECTKFLSVEFALEEDFNDEDYYLLAEAFLFVTEEMRLDMPALPPKIPGDSRTTTKTEK